MSETKDLAANAAKARFDNSSAAFAAVMLSRMNYPQLTPTASAPVKAIEQSGESPVRGIRYRPVVEGNCVFNRKGGEQPETKEQSVTQVNSIQPSLSGSILATREPLTARHVPNEAQLRVAERNRRAVRRRRR